MYPNGTPENVIEDLSLAATTNVVPRETFKLGWFIRTLSHSFLPFRRWTSVLLQKIEAPSIDPNFDPLLSPHVYANGTPDKVLVYLSSAIGQQRQQGETFEPLDSNGFFRFSPLSLLPNTALLPLQRRHRP
jgi:hypothetical protein